MLQFAKLSVTIGEPMPTWKTENKITVRKAGHTIHQGRGVADVVMSIVDRSAAAQHYFTFVVKILNSNTIPTSSDLD